MRHTERIGTRKIIAEEARAVTHSKEKYVGRQLRGRVDGRVTPRMFTMVERRVCRY